MNFGSGSESDDDHDNDEHLVTINDSLDVAGADSNGEANRSDDDSDEDAESHLLPDDDASESESISSDVSVKDFIDVLNIGDLLNKCRIIIGTIRKSDILNDVVHKIAHRFGIDVDLILDMRIRWNSSYKMLNRLLVFQPVLDELFSDLIGLSGVTKKQQAKLRKNQLCISDWDILKSLRDVLERFSDATDLVSGKNYPTLSIAYAVKLSLDHFLSDGAGDMNSRLIKQMLQVEFDRYMTLPIDSKEATVISVAALLDPSTHDILKPEDRTAAEKFLVIEVL